MKHISEVKGGLYRLEDISEEGVNHWWVHRPGGVVVVHWPLLYMRLGAAYVTRWKHYTASGNYGYASRWCSATCG